MCTGLDQTRNAIIKLLTFCCQNSPTSLSGDECQRSFSLTTITHNITIKLFSRIKKWVVISVELDTNNHSVFSLNYHLILVVKYRRKVIDDEISDRLKVIFESIQMNYNITLQEWNHDKDHVHILMKAHPNSDISKFLNAYKSASSRLIKKEFPIIRKQLWKEYFWSRSYCLITTGGAPIDVIRKYIESQGQK